MPYMLSSPRESTGDQKVQQMQSDELKHDASAPAQDDAQPKKQLSPAAERALAEAASRLVDRDPRPLVLIAGMFARKDARGFFLPFAEMHPTVFTTTFDSPNAASACFLWHVVVMTSIPPKYFLSAQACAGILLRAARRGKKLPALLDRVLQQQADTQDSLD
jgi:hypothetical protein